MPQPFRWPKRGTTHGEAGLREGFRSGLEEINAAHIEKHGVVVAFESIKVPYAQPCTAHTYTPDFPLPNGIIVETKGRFVSQDRAKHLLVKAQYPDLDIRFVFSNPNARINPGSSTTLAEWCRRNGYQWAKKLVPVEWLMEPGPERSVQAVLAAGPKGYESIIRAGMPKKRRA